MPKQTELHDQIVRASAELFMKQSYAATSIKQIAQAAGCTTAALYYYFEDGKAGILRAVIDKAMPDIAGLLQPVAGAASLRDLIVGLGVALWAEGEDILRRTRWLMVEFPNLGESERRTLHTRLLQFHQRLAELILPFAANRQQAEALAWIAFSAVFGYGQLFVTLDLLSACEPPHEAFVYGLATMMAQTVGHAPRP
ncbi:MAG: TetR/AcrR family transcriptional regulator [Anaerolineae bacterium]|nr:TetR/AcrR family transcriptional regulator [Anaerolineae bacterium]